MQWWSPTEFGENHCLQLRNTTVCSGLCTLGSYLDPLLKNASGISLRTTSQRRLLPWSYLIIPVHPLSPLTLFGTSSRNESALPSPSPSSPFWHAPFVHRAESPEEGPGSPKPYHPTGICRLWMSSPMSPWAGNPQLQDRGPGIRRQAEPPAKITLQQR